MSITIENVFSSRRLNFGRRGNSLTISGRWSATKVLEEGLFDPREAVALRDFLNKEFPPSLADNVGNSWREVADADVVVAIYPDGTSRKFKDRNGNASVNVETTRKVTIEC